jgi:hypothetical protein
LAWQTTFLTRISNIVSFFFQFSSAIFLKQLPQVRWKTNKCNFRIDLVGCPFSGYDFFSLSCYICPFKWVSGDFPKLIQRALAWYRNLEKIILRYPSRVVCSIHKEVERFDHLTWMPMPSILTQF